MENTLTIDGRQVTFKGTGAFLLRYKAQFGRDAIQDIFQLQKAIKVDEQGQASIEDISAIDLEVFYNLLWTLAKAADPAIPPPMEWLDTFDEFPLLEILPETMELIFSCLQSQAKSKKK